jgi:hypothetical protein
MWAGLDQQREQIRRAGLELAPGELLAAATGRGARLEGITAGGISTGRGSSRTAAGGVLPAGQDLLFLVRADGQLAAVTQTDTPMPRSGDTIVSLGPALAAQPADRRS